MKVKCRIKETSKFNKKQQIGNIQEHRGNE